MAKNRYTNNTQSTKKSILILKIESHWDRYNSPNHLNIRTSQGHSLTAEDMLAEDHSGGETSSRVSTDEAPQDPHPQTSTSADTSFSHSVSAAQSALKSWWSGPKTPAKTEGSKSSENPTSPPKDGTHALPTSPSSTKLVAKSSSVANIPTPAPQAQVPAPTVKADETGSKTPVESNYKIELTFPRFFYRLRFC